MNFLKKLIDNPVYYFVYCITVTVVVLGLALLFAR